MTFSEIKSVTALLQMSLVLFYQTRFMLFCILEQAADYEQYCLQFTQNKCIHYLFYSNMERNLEKYRKSSLYVICVHVRLKAYSA